MSGPWYEDGLRFECTRCGNCCGGAPGTVLVGEAEIEALARRLDLSVEEFRRTHTRVVSGGAVSLREKANWDCVFYDRRRGCTVYEDRPRQCRTWPFWKSVVRTPRSWARAGRECPGIGRGELLPPERIDERARNDGTSAELPVVQRVRYRFGEAFRSPTRRAGEAGEKRS